LQIDQLLELDLEIDIRSRLGKLPEGLEKAYDEIFGQIRKKLGSQSTIAQRAFQWLMCSAKPIRPEELVVAVCQDAEKDSFIEPYVDIGFVLKACDNLLIVDLEGICRFSNLSVQEYLEENVWTTSQANAHVAKVCLVALNDIKFYQQLTKSTRFFAYVHEQLYEHIRHHGENEKDGRLSMLLKQFFGSMEESGPAYRRWYENCEEQGYRIDGFEELSPSSSASFGICLFGVIELLSSCWETGFVDTEQKNEKRTPLLQIAIVGGSILSTKALLSQGANIQAQGGDYSTALQAASFFGYQPIVELLLREGADVQAQGGDYGTALQAASYSGHQAIVELLLREGADVQAQGGGCGTALQAASTCGHQAIVELLLREGADIQAQAGDLGTALQAASYRGHQAIVELLLREGADIQAQAGHFGTALQAAATFYGNQAIVELLLREGADIQAQGGEYGTALQAASACGNQAIVELLLREGANVQAKGGMISAILPTRLYSYANSVYTMIVH
jgi:ankyrin repeat protein